MTAKPMSAAKLKRVENRAKAADEAGSTGDGEYLDFEAHALADVRALITEVRRLRAALQAYAAHGLGCSEGAPVPCVCGLAEALR